MFISSTPYVDAEGPQYYQLITIKHSIQWAAVAITASHQRKTNASKRHMVFWCKTLHFKCLKKPGEKQFDWWQWSYHQETPVQSDFRNKMNVLSDAAEPASLSICAMENDHVNP